MASHADQTQKEGPYVVKLIIGLALAIGGFFVSTNFQLDVLKDLGEKGLPIDLGKTVATIGVFLILFPVIRSFFVDPLRNAIHERTSNLERAFSEAESLRSEMGQMKKDYEAQLVAAEAAAREQIQSQIREAQQLRTQLMAEASERADQMVARAKEEIATERDRVLTELRGQVVDLTLSATEHLLGETMNDPRHRKLVEDFIAKVEAPA